MTRLPAAWIAALMLAPLPLAAASGGGAHEAARAISPVATFVPDAASLWDGTTALLFGGTGCHENQDPCRRIARYDPVTGEVRLVPARLPVPFHHPVVAWAGGVAVLFGADARCGSGFCEASLEIARYDPSTGDARLARARLPEGFDPEVAVGVGLHAYVFGGWNAAELGAVSAILRYDGARDVLEEVETTLPAELHGFAAVAAPDAIYLLGGWLQGPEGPVPAEPAVLRFDPRTERIEAMAAEFPAPPDLPAAAGSRAGRALGAALWDGERVLLVGGCVLTAPPEAYCTPSDEILRFDPRDASFDRAEATLPIASYDVAGHWLGDRALLFTPAPHSPRVRSVLVYDPARGVEDRSPIPADIPEGVAAQREGGAILFLTGDEDSARFAALDPVRMEARVGNATLVTRGDSAERLRFPAMSASPEGTFAFGGFLNWEASDRIWRRDPATGDVSVAAARLPQPRGAVAAAGLGGAVYLFGGRGNGSDEAAIHRFDPARDAISAIDARFPTGRAFASAVAADGRILVFGGHDGEPLDEIWRFDPAAGKLEQAHARLPSARFATSAAWDGRYAYVFGGAGADGFLDEIVRYDPAADRAERMRATLPSPRYGTAAAWFDGAILVLGGDPWTPLVRYEPALDRVSPASSPRRPTATEGTEGLPLTIRGSTTWEPGDVGWWSVDASASALAGVTWSWNGRVVSAKGWGAPDAWTGARSTPRSELSHGPLMPGTHTLEAVVREPGGGRLLTRVGTLRVDVAFNATICDPTTPFSAHAPRSAAPPVLVLVPDAAPTSDAVTRLADALVASDPWADPRAKDDPDAFWRDEDDPIVRRNRIEVVRSGADPRRSFAEAVGDLQRELLHIAEDHAGRPLVVLAHGAGGLLVRGLREHACHRIPGSMWAEHVSPEWAARIVAVYFLGVPHAGTRHYERGLLATGIPAADVATMLAGNLRPGGAVPSSFPSQAQASWNYTVLLGAGPPGAPPGDGVSPVESQRLPGAREATFPVCFDPSGAGFVDAAQRAHCAARSYGSDPDLLAFLNADLERLERDLSGTTPAKALADRLAREPWLERATPFAGVVALVALGLAAAFGGFVARRGRAP